MSFRFCTVKCTSTHALVQPSIKHKSDHKVAAGSLVMWTENPCCIFLYVYRHIRHYDCTLAVSCGSVELNHPGDWDNMLIRSGVRMLPSMHSKRSRFSLLCPSASLNPDKSSTSSAGHVCPYNPDSVQDRWSASRGHDCSTVRFLGIYSLLNSNPYQVGTDRRTTWFFSFRIL